MSQTRVAQHRFSAGEWSPLLHASTDLERYYSALKTASNLILLTPGGFFRRWGMPYVASCETSPPFTLSLDDKTVGAARTFTTSGAYWNADDVGRVISSGAGRATITSYHVASGTAIATTTVEFASTGPIAAGSWSVTPARRVRLLPFVFSEDDAVVVEASSGLMRYYHYSSGTPALVTSGGSPVRTTSTGIAAADLQSIQSMQSGDVLAMVNGAWHPKSLSRLAVDNTSWSLSSMAFDVPATFQAKENVSQQATLSEATVGTGRTITIGSSWFLQGDVGRIITWRQGRAIITGYTSGTVMVIEIISAFESVTLPDDAWYIFGAPKTGLGTSGALNRTIGAGETVTVTSYNYGVATACWRAEDVGKYLVTNDGPLIITGYTNSTTVTAIALAPITFTYYASSAGHISFVGEWTQEVKAWSADYGYPRACCMHQQRALYGPTDESPATFWGGPPGEFYSLAKGTDDDAGFEWTIASGQMDSIRAMSPGKILTIGTVGELHTAIGADGGVLAPSKPPQIDPIESGVGVASIQPIRAAGESFFVGRGQRALYGVAYDIVRETKKAVNKLLEAEHLTASGKIVETCVQRCQGPLGGVTVVWCLLNDTAGTLIGMTYDPDQKVMGWHTQTTDGVIESVCAVPNPTTGYDDLWLAVARTIGGATVRMIEVLTAGRYLDSAVSGTNSPASAVITGLSHLEGESVVTRATRASDGALVLLPAETVSGGQITVDAAVTAYEVGLPYTMTAVTLPLGVPGQSLLGVPKAYGPMTVSCYDTPSLKVQGHRYAAGSQESTYAAAAIYVVPTTAAIAPSGTAQGGALQNLGVDVEGTVTIIQDLPLQTTVLALSAEVTIGR